MADEQGAGGGSLVGQSLGDYLLRGVLGVGGMAEVYRAMDLTLEREVAVKVLPAAFATDPGYVQRFRDEAKQVAALNHPHIMPIYAFGEERGYFYHVMPMLHTSLRDRLLKDRTLAPEEAVRLVRQIASALEAAHALGLVHRDVKPENILLDTEGNALLTDFGIARELAALRQAGVARTLSRTGMPVGTPEYMAPEQLRAEPCDQRADIYGLGAVLYEVLTGVPPHEAASPFEVAALVLSAPILPPSQRNPHVWPALEQVVQKALELDPANRFPDMQSFAAALELALHRTDALWSARTLPPVAGNRETRLLPLGLPLALPASLRRPRTLVAASLALVLVAVVLGTGLLVAQAIGGGRPSASGANPPESLPAVTATTSSTATPKQTATTPAPPPAPPPTASPVPSGPLSFAPSPLVLSPQGNTCTATQNIANTGSRTLGWYWDTKMPSDFEFSVNGHRATNWPTDFSGIRPGEHDTLAVTGPCTAMTKSIVVSDTQGNAYTFTLQVP